MTRERKGGGQVINKHVRMSDRNEIGVQLFLLMASHGNHVTAASTVSLSQLHLNS
jgi:hypothetical protein